MRIWMNLAVATAALGAGGATLFAQWPDYRTAGPRTPDGKIDIKGPAPRTAAGRPDFSGLWEQADSKRVSFNGTPPLPFEIPSAPDDPPVAQFFPAVGRRIARGAESEQRQRQFRRALPADGSDAAPHAYSAA